MYYVEGMEHRDNNNHIMVTCGRLYYLEHFIGACCAPSALTLNHHNVKLHEVDVESYLK